MIQPIIDFVISNEYLREHKQLIFEYIHKNYLCDDYKVDKSFNSDFAEKVVKILVIVGNNNEHLLITNFGNIGKITNKLNYDYHFRIENKFSDKLLVCGIHDV